MLSGSSAAGAISTTASAVIDKPRVPAGNIEMMNDVAGRILVREHFRARLRRQLKPEAPLPAVASGLHAHFHHALADGRGVGESVRVPDDVLNVAAHHAIADSVR